MAPSRPYAARYTLGLGKWQPIAAGVPKPVYRSSMVNTQITMLEALNAMTPAQYKTVENRLRAEAQRQGLRLERSRIRNPLAPEFGTYGLVEGPPPSAGGDNWRSRVLVAGDPNTGFGLTLEDVARHLYSYRPLVWRGPRTERDATYHQFAITDDNENEFLILLSPKAAQLRVRRLGEFRDEHFSLFPIAEGEGYASAVRRAQAKADEVSRQLWATHPVQH